MMATNVPGAKPLMSDAPYDADDYKTPLPLGTDAPMTALPVGPVWQAPIDMLLFCPRCGLQHIDAAESYGPGPGDPGGITWANPPHRSHLCHACKTIWRPADMATNGVATIGTKGSADTWLNYGQRARPVAEGSGEAASVQDHKHVDAQALAENCDRLTRTNGELVKALEIIVANAALIPDPAMGFTTDCYAVPVDDIAAAIAALKSAAQEA